MSTRTTRRPGIVLAAALIALAVPGSAADEPSIAELLLAVKHQRECRITTAGRKSGRPHTVPIWFAVASDALYLSTMDPSRDWVKNALATPTVAVDFGELRLTGRFRDVTGTELDPAVRDALRSKYWIARAAGWFGQGPKATFVIDQLAPAPPAGP